MLTIKYFTASWCQPCKMFGPVFDEVINKTGISHAKIDADNNKDAVVKYNISSVPTIIFEIGENIVYRNSGVMSRGQLIEMIGKFS